jgi:hypothetical protein
MAKAETWRKISERSYERRTERSDAFVFGANRPMCLWAWSVYWNGGGNSSGVMHGFRNAKRKAELEDLILMGEVKRGKS